MHYQDVDLKNYFKMPNYGLKSYFGRVRAGNEVEYRTTFYKGKSLTSILDDWASQCESISRTYPNLWEYECDMRDKVGPLSIMKPLRDRMGDVVSYFEDSHLPQVSFDSSTINLVLTEFSSLRGLKVRSHSDTLLNMKLSTNSGNPFFTKRRLVANKVLDATLTPDGVQVYSDGSHYKSCAILGWRGQEGGLEFDDVKQRVVWMFPFLVNLYELSLYQPLIELCQRNNLVPAWISMDAVDRRVTQLFDSIEKGDVIMCTDFTKFDQHFGSSMQDCAKRILSGLVDSNHSASKYWLDSVFPQKYIMPLMYDLGSVIEGHHGMGSGSGGTNADETLAHRALQHEAAQSENQRLNLNSMCLGDDGILSFPKMDPEKVISCYTQHGLVMNPSKQSIDPNNCVYLRRWHSRTFRYHGICVGVYSTFRALGRLCEQERFYNPNQWGPEMVALRQLSILENCKWHPLKEEFVKFCMKGDSYRLGLDIPGFLENVQRIALEAETAYTDFIGYTKSQQLTSTSGID